jgi:type 1 glutamine amidotransferase
MAVRNLIVSGGVGHPFEETSGRLSDLFAAEGLESEITTDIDDGFAALGDPGVFGLVTVNALRWQMTAEKYAEARPNWAFALSSPARRGLRAHLDAGGGLLGVHTASICFDDWPEWGEILGGRWNWERSGHPPVGPATIHVADPGDPLVSGVQDFPTFDEIYGFLDLESDVRPLLTSAHGGGVHPMLWRRLVGRGRVVYDALGHDLRAYDNEAHCTVVRRAARWAAGC